jgi:hypothetical protein
MSTETQVSDAVAERLRKSKNVTQFNSGGVLETFEGFPSPLELEAADLIERQQKEIAELRAVKEAFRYYIDASDREISDAGMTRDGALRRARDLDALLNGGVE